MESMTTDNLRMYCRICGSVEAKEGEREMMFCSECGDYLGQRGEAFDAEDE